MALVGKASAVGVDRQPGVGLVLPGVGTVVPTVWSILIGAVGRGDDDSGEYLCGVTTPYHREAGEMEIRFILGDTGGQLCATVFVDAVCRHIHRPLAGNSVAVGGPAATSGGLKMRDEI